MKGFRFLIFLFTVLAFLLTACPFSSPFKVGQPELPDAKWTGIWEHKKMLNDSVVTDKLNIKIKNKEEIFLSSYIHFLNTERPQRRSLKGYPVSVGTHKLVLLYSLNHNPDQLYMYFKYDFPEPGILILRALNDEKVPDNLSTASALEAWILEQGNDQSIWEEPVPYSQVKPVNTADVHK